MEDQVMHGLEWLLAVLSLPKLGLPAVFLIALVSATLLPLGSEPAVLALIKLNPTLFWPTLAVATLGNTMGGAITWAMGYGAEKVYEEARHKDASHVRASAWLRRFGPKACLLAWLPVVGDPLCAVAGWLRLPFWPCVGYMAVGKGLRYWSLAAAMVWALS